MFELKIHIDVCLDARSLKFAHIPMLF